jgi:RNA polymerase-interacting CarD/CdnL/TRCF family regulator
MLDSGASGFMTHHYQPGDWIVHRRYGIGRIEAIEMQSISGEPAEYYRATNDRSTFWVPVEKLDEEMARPPATRDEIVEALTFFDKPARSLPRRFDRRKARIRKVKINYTLEGAVKLIRDMWAHQRENPLRPSEKRFLDRLVDRLAQEWAISSELQETEAQQRIRARFTSGKQVAAD